MKRGDNIMKKMSEYDYHYGLIVRIYPNTEQKQIISVNSDVSRFVYNKMVQFGKEIYAFGKLSIYIKVVDERLTYLKELNYEFWRGFYCCKEGQ